MTRLFSELQTERNWIEKEMDKVFREKVASLALALFFFNISGAADDRAEGRGQSH